MSIKSFKLSWIVVSDLNKSIEYFCDRLGLHLRTKDDKYGWAELSGSEGGARIGIAQANSHTEIAAGNNAVITLTVDNLEKAKADYAKKGVRFQGDILEVPHMVKLQTFVDLDGNMFQLVEELHGNK